MKTPENDKPEIPALADLISDASDAVEAKAKTNRGPCVKVTAKNEVATGRDFVSGAFARGPPNVELGAMTIAEFCARYHINRVTLFKLRRSGLGPDTLQIGRKVLITFEAAKAWEARMTARGAAKANDTATA